MHLIPISLLALAFWTGDPQPTENAATPAAPSAPEASPKAKSAHTSDLPMPGVANWGDPTCTIVETVIEAPVRAVWHVFSTEEGFTTLGVAKCRMDFRVGGFIHASYDPNASLDEPGHIVNAILSLDPERMLSIRIQEAPTGFPFPTAWKSVWTVITLTPEGPDRTRVRLSMLGYDPANEESQKMRAFFEKGNAWTLRRLKDKLDADDVKQRADRAWDTLRSFVGEPGRGCTTFSGASLCATTTWTLGPGDRSILYLIRLGPDPANQRPHIQMVFSRDPTSTAVTLTGVDDQGRDFRGTVSPIADNGVALRWAAPGSSGAPEPVLVTYTPSAQPGYVQRNYRGVTDPAGAKPWVELTYTRNAGDKPLPEASDGARQSGAASIDSALFVASGAKPMQPPIVREAVVDGSPDEVFALWTTREGLTSWLVQDARVDLRIGGPFEVYFNAGAPAGERGSEGCQVLAYVSGSMLAFSWNAPPKFPAQRQQRTWVTLQFSDAQTIMSPENAGKARVLLTHTGFGAGPEWAEVRAYFENAWPRVLDALQSHLDSRAAK